MVSISVAMTMRSQKSPIIAQCTEYSIEAFGGTETLVRTLVRRLSEDYRLLLVSADDSGNVAKSEMGPLLRHQIQWHPEMASVATAKNLARQLRDHDVDLAHFHFGGNYGWGNRALNRCPVIHVHRAGIPCLSTNHGVFELLDGYCAPWRPLWMKLALFPPAWISKAHVLAHTSREIAVSKNDLGNLRKWYWPLRGKFRQLYHSKIEADWPGHNGAPRQKVILCVGSIGFRKGQTVLAEAFEKIAAQHPDWKLILAGRRSEPSLVGQIESIRSRLKDKLQLVDNLSDAAITELMQTSEIFVMPSLHEGLGLSLQEALFHGCACIASQVGGIPELIDNEENGLLVRPGDVGQLAAALEKLMSNAAMRESFSARSRRSVLEKGMTAARMVQGYQQLYQQILSRCV